MCWWRKPTTSFLPRQFVGFEELPGDALIATDGGEEIRAPAEGCTIIMPTRRIMKGRDVVSIARRLQ